MKNNKEIEESLYVLKLFQMHRDLFWRNLMEKCNDEQICLISDLLAETYSYLPSIDDEDKKSMLILAARKSYFYLYDSGRVQKDIKEKLLVYVYIPAVMNGDVQIAALLFFKKESGIDDIIKTAGVQLPLVEHIFYDLWDGILDESNSTIFLEIIYTFYKREKDLLVKFFDEILQAAFIVERKYGTSELLTNKHACEVLNTLTYMCSAE